MVKLFERGITLTLKVKNIDSNPFTFTGCFHTYFKFTDTSKVKLHGFHKNTFLDKVDNKKQKTQHEILSIQTEAEQSAKEAGLSHGFVDYIYLNSPNEFEFKQDETTLYKIKQSESWTDTTIYNP